MRTAGYRGRTVIVQQMWLTWHLRNGYAKQRSTWYLPTVYRLEALRLVWHAMKP